MIVHVYSASYEPCEGEVNDEGLPAYERPRHHIAGHRPRDVHTSIWHGFGGGDDNVSQMHCSRGQAEHGRPAVRAGLAQFVYKRV